MTTLANLLPLLEGIAPLPYAEDWDNVGLILEPPPGRDAHEVLRILLTVDFGEDILREARDEKVQLVIAYHPPIFQGLKCLTRRTAEERVVMEALRAGIALYSPHTALDAAPDGVNDWLASSLGPGTREPVVPARDGAPGFGMGRSVALDEPATLEALVGRVKQYLGLDRVRVAESEPHRRGDLIRYAAVCAGAGGALLSPLSGVDLYLTGEMRHHDVRAKVAAGSSVILCDHTNTERGYLEVLGRRLRELEPAVQVVVSRVDRDPLRIV